MLAYFSVLLLVSILLCLWPCIFLKISQYLQFFHVSLVSECWNKIHFFGNHTPNLNFHFDARVQLFQKKKKICKQLRLHRSSIENILLRQEQETQIFGSAYKGTVGGTILSKQVLNGGPRIKLGLPCLAL